VPGSIRESPIQFIDAAQEMPLVLDESCEGSSGETANDNRSDRVGGKAVPGLPMGIRDFMVDLHN
jgi:hypothetical protein